MTNNETLAIATAYLEEQRVLHRVEAEDGCIVATLFLDHGAYRLLLVAERPEAVQLLLPFLLAVPPERRAVVAQVAAHVNSTIRLGSFCLDLRDGELRFDLPLTFDPVLTPMLLERGLGAIAWTLDTYMPAMQRACWSDDPAETILGFALPDGAQLLLDQLRQQLGETSPGDEDNTDDDDSDAERSA